MKTVVWYASSGAIAYAGPFPTQVKACQFIRLSEDCMEEMDTDRPYAPNAFVWPEEIDKPSKNRNRGKKPTRRKHK